MSLTGKLTHSENLHCVGRLEIGQAGYLLNRPRMSIYLKLQREERRAFSGCFSPKGGGGGTLIFSAYVGSDPASTLHHKKKSGISSIPKNI